MKFVCFAYRAQTKVWFSECVRVPAWFVCLCVDGCKVVEMAQPPLHGIREPIKAYKNIYETILTFSVRRRVVVGISTPHRKHV